MSKISNYDLLLTEYWSDRHSQMVEDCEGADESFKRKSGLETLRWSYDSAPSQIEPISTGWTGHYYIRGSYQVLAIGLQVGWHPDYLKILKE